MIDSMMSYVKSIRSIVTNELLVMWTWTDLGWWSRWWGLLQRRVQYCNKSVLSKLRCIRISIPFTQRTKWGVMPRTQRSLEKNLKTLSKSTSRTKGKSSTKSLESQSELEVKFTRCKDITLFPHNLFPWRLEPKTKKFNLTWTQCYEHAVKKIQNEHLKPKDYKLQCYVSVPMSDPLTGPVRYARTVRGPNTPIA